MWRIILVTVFIIACLVGTHFAAAVWGFKLHEDAVRKDEKAGLKGAEMLKQANQILDDLANPSSLEAASYINTSTRPRVLAWLSAYSQTFKKGSK